MRSSSLFLSVSAVKRVRKKPVSSVRFFLGVSGGGKGEGGGL